MIILCSGKPHEAIAARLVENGIPFKLSTGEVPTLDLCSSSDILMVPIGALKQPDWPQFRAQIWNLRIRTHNKIAIEFLAYQMRIPNNSSCFVFNFLPHRISPIENFDFVGGINLFQICRTYQ